MMLMRAAMCDRVAHALQRQDGRGGGGGGGGYLSSKRNKQILYRTEKTTNMAIDEVGAKVEEVGGECAGGSHMNARLNCARAKNDAVDISATFLLLLHRHFIKAAPNLLTRALV
jgi:hypothetical protein